ACGRRRRQSPLPLGERSAERSGGWVRGSALCDFSKKNDPGNRRRFPGSRVEETRRGFRLLNGLRRYRRPAGPAC
ncbi:MAG: hypothetical protein E5W03_10110, partial [Mesorhizobium sp.]